MHKVKVFTHLSNEERAKTEVLVQQGFGVRAIATVLNRAPSTISRELKRNRCGSPRRKGPYRAAAAGKKAALRHRQKPKHRVFDLSQKRFIAHQLRTRRLSPELISVEGRKGCADFVSHEWIYRWIWQQKHSHRKKDRYFQKLYTYLRHASRRRRRGRKHSQRGNILHRVWIEQRPQTATTRSRRGHLEADIVLGAGRKPGLLVVVDRKTRRAWVRKLPTKEAPFVAAKLKSICKAIADVKTITMDNDQSFAHHYQLHALGVKTFFTHPYSAQEKGSVENRIGLVRMFFPKTTDFQNITQQRIKSVENILNNRPLRMFNYKAPNQLYQKSPPL